MMEDARAYKDALENLNTPKSTSGRILTGILSKNSKLESNLSAKKKKNPKIANVIRHP